MNIEDVEQKLAVRRYVEHMRHIADLEEIPKNIMEALELRNFINQLSDYRNDILWARKNLAAECRMINKIISDLENKIRGGKYEI